MFVRTVLGDMAAGELGPCSAHEHVIIDSAHVTERDPDLRLDDVERAVTELRAFHAAGGRWLIDTMPGGCGRQAGKLALISQRSEVAIVCCTGVHLPIYYPADHPVHGLSAEAMVALFMREIEQGIEAPEASREGGPTTIRAGVIKVASGGDRLTAREREIFAAAAVTQRRLGCPIITHTQQGMAAMEQVEVLAGHGASLEHVVLSHVDRVTDVGYHRALLETGVCLEYDAAFRWKQRADNPTIDLLATLLPMYPEQLMVGMDAARRSYWQSYGGGPGLHWLVQGLRDQLRTAGLADDLLHKLYIASPGGAFAFAPVRESH